jgi:hypothetical protein
VSGDEVTKARVRKLQPVKSKANWEVKWQAMDKYLAQGWTKYFAQGCPDKNGFQLIQSVLLSHSVLIKVRFTSAEGRVFVRTLQGLMITGRTMLAVNHLLKGVTKDGELELRSSRGLVLCTCSIAEVELCDMSHSDLVLITFPGRCQMFTDIRKHISNDEINGIDSFSGVLVKLIDQGGDVIPMIYTIPRLHLLGKMSYDCDGETLHLYSHYMYEVNTEVGDCGAVLMVLNKGILRKIIGMHVAGAPSRREGISTPVNVADIDEALQQHAIITSEEPVWEDEYVAQGTPLSNRQLLTEGSVKPHFQQRQPKSSAIIPSLLHGKSAPPITAPSAMSGSFDGKTPLEIGLNKMPERSFTCTPKVLCRAFKDFQNSILTMSNRDLHPRLLTLHEAINGDPLDEYVKPLNMATSPGYPYTSMKSPHKFKGKRAWFDGEEGNFTPVPEVMERINKRLHYAKRGVVSSTLFCDILKDERRTLDKVENGKTLVFREGTVDLTILLRISFDKIIN